LQAATVHITQHKSRDLATRLSSVGVLERSFMTTVQYWRSLQIHLYSTHLRQWRPMWSPLMELPYATSVRYWCPTWGQRQTCPYSTSLRYFDPFLLAILLTHLSRSL